MYDKEYVSRKEFDEFRIKVKERFERLEERSDGAKEEKGGSWFSRGSSKDETKKLKQDLEAVQQAHETLKERLQKCNEQIQELENERDSLLVRLKNEQESFRRQQESFKRERDSLQEQLREAQGQCKQMEGSVAELSHENKSLKEKCERYQKGVAGVYEFYQSLSMDFQNRFSFIDAQTEVSFVVSSMDRDILKHLYEFIKSDAKAAYKEGREVSGDLLKLFEYLYVWHAGRDGLLRLDTNVGDSYYEVEQIQIGGGSSFGSVKRVLFKGFRQSGQIYRSLVMSE